VDDSGPAKEARLEPGDVIIKFDGKDIATVRDLPRLVAATPVGKEVEVVVIRKGEEITKKVTIARLNESASASASSSTRDATPEVKRALGLTTSTITEETRRRYGLKEDLKGVVVTQVDPDSSAADKRIQPGDVIV